MTTNNQKLMLVSNFALRAKVHLGAINLSEMLNNKNYAFDKLAQATLTGDSELLDLTKIVCSEFNIGTDLINAIDSYIQNIAEINDDENFILQSKFFLIKFANLLYGIKINGLTYRQAVEQLLLTIKNDERTFAINLARKFYPYCGGQNRTLTKDEIVKRSKATEQKNAFIKVWANLDNEFFYDKEISTIGLYVEFMHENSYSEKDISISERIAKIITLEIRKKQIDPANAYRNAVNQTQSLFDNDDLKNITMIVSREFYNFWLGNIPQLWGYM